MKKKKKNTALKVIIIILVMLIAGGAIWYFAIGKNLLNKDDTEETVDVEVKAGQTLTIGKLTAVNGNEITYTVMEEAEEAEAPSESAFESTDENKGGDFKGGHGNGQGKRSDDSGSDSSLEEGMPDMSEMPNMGDKSEEGEMPDMGNMPGKGDSDSESGQSMPNMGEMPDMGEMPGGFGGDSGDFGGFGDFNNFENSENNETTVDDTISYKDLTYKVTDVSKTVLIPVGTDVTTKLGTVTTFSRLEAGDYVAIVTETVDGEEVILAVYIIG